MPRRFLMLAALFAALAAPAAAQAPQGAPANVRGTVVSFAGTMLIVNARDGTQVSIRVPETVMVSAEAMKSLSDIKQGDFVGTTAIPGTDGKLHAKEVHIFPEALRGTGEGHRPYDYAPQSTTTNATVAGVASTPHGTQLTLTYKGGTTEVEVDPGTPIVAPIPGDRSLLKPGAAVVISTLKQPDGSLVARRITAEKNGVKPVT